jgi:hypothetical protein
MKFEKDTSGIKRYVAFDIHKEYALVGGDKMHGRNGYCNRVGSGWRNSASGRKPISAQRTRPSSRQPPTCGTFTTWWSRW